MINLPFSPNLDDILKEFASPNIGIVSLGDISSLLNHPAYLMKYIMLFLHLRSMLLRYDAILLVPILVGWSLGQYLCH